MQYHSRVKRLKSILSCFDFTLLYLQLRLDNTEYNTKNNTKYNTKDNTKYNTKDNTKDNT